jgi:hypothetical protein
MHADYLAIEQQLRDEGYEDSVRALQDPAVGRLIEEKYWRGEV